MRRNDDAGRAARGQSPVAEFVGQFRSAWSRGETLTGTVSLMSGRSGRSPTAPPLQRLQDGGGFVTTCSVPCHISMVRQADLEL